MVGCTIAKCHRPFSPLKVRTIHNSTSKDCYSHRIEDLLYETPQDRPMVEGSHYFYNLLRLSQEPFPLAHHHKRLHKYTDSFCLRQHQECPEKSPLQVLLRTDCRLSIQYNYNEKYHHADN